MGSLTVVGLLLDLAGAVILLGPEFKPVGKYVRKLDPIHRLLTFGIETLREEATDRDEGAYKYDVDAGRWELWGLRYFLNRRIVGRIEPDDTLSINGRWFHISGQQPMLAEPPNKNRPEEVGLKSLSAVIDLVEDAQTRRIYLYGVGLLALGFGLQLIDQAIPLLQSLG